MVTIANLSCTEGVEISLESVEKEIPTTAECTILCNEDMHAHNTFESPDAVIPSETALNPKKPFIIPKAGILSIRF